MNEVNNNLVELGGETHRQMASVLVEALPYIRKWRGKIVVIKYGGNAMASDANDEKEILKSFANDVAILQSVGIRVVVVHGGGPQIGEMMQKLGKTPEFVDGNRVTDQETLDIARMVLVGKVNRDIVSSINMHGPLAVGLSGEDAQLIIASLRHESLGFVGDVKVVDPTILIRLLSEDLVPVIATIGTDESGQSYNINADVVAARVAEALESEKLIYLTDVVGVLKDRDNPESLISVLDISCAKQLIDQNVIVGGMIPKIKAAIGAVENGVKSVHILDGRVLNSLLIELFSVSGFGTMVTK